MGRGGKNAGKGKGLIESVKGGKGFGKSFAPPHVPQKGYAPPHLPSKGYGPPPHVPSKGYAPPHVPQKGYAPPPVQHQGYGAYHEDTLDVGRPEEREYGTLDEWDGSIGRIRPDGRAGKHGEKIFLCKDNVQDEVLKAGQRIKFTRTTAKDWWKYMQQRGLPKDQWAAVNARVHTSDEYKNKGRTRGVDSGEAKAGIPDARIGVPEGERRESQRCDSQRHDLRRGALDRREEQRSEPEPREEVPKAPVSFSATVIPAPSNGAGPSRAARVDVDDAKSDFGMKTECDPEEFRSDPFEPPAFRMPHPGYSPEVSALLGATNTPVADSESSNAAEAATIQRSPRFETACNADLVINPHFNILDLGPGQLDARRKIQFALKCALDVDTTCELLKLEKTLAQKVMDLFEHTMPTDASRVNFAFMQALYERKRQKHEEDRKELSAESEATIADATSKQLAAKREFDEAKRLEGLRRATEEDKEARRRQSECDSRRTDPHDNDRKRQREEEMRRDGDFRRRDEGLEERRQAVKREKEEAQRQEEIRRAQAESDRGRTDSRSVHRSAEDKRHSGPSAERQRSQDHFRSHEGRRHDDERRHDDDRRNREEARRWDTSRSLDERTTPSSRCHSRRSSIVLTPRPGARARSRSPRTASWSRGEPPKRPILQSPVGRSRPEYP